jgi:prepilin-type N-terminal cleavage/methylation domain-containing protein
MKPASGRQAGFSLVELMAASLIFLVMAGALLAVMRISLILHHSTQQGLELQQNVRSALNIICRELINAGSGIPYLTPINGSPPIAVSVGAHVGPLGSPVQSGLLYFVTPSHGTGQEVTYNGEGNPLPTTIQTDMLTFLGGMGDFRFVNQNSPGPTSGWGAIVFLEDNSVFRDGQLVLITNGFQVSLGQITQVLPNGGLQFSNGNDELGLNSPGSGANPNPNHFAARQIPGGPPPIVYTLSSITYFIDSSTDPAHPMLKRIANSAGGANASVAVADNIENLQVSFLVDDDANATTPSIVIDSPALNQLSLVRGVTVTITGRSQIRIGDTSHDDQHSRLTMSQTVFFRNNVRR